MLYIFSSLYDSEIFILNCSLYVYYNFVSFIVLLNNQYDMTHYNLRFVSDHNSGTKTYIEGHMEIHT